MFDKNSEASFLLNGVFEFIKVWQSGIQSTLNLHSKKGKAWINFNCCLGGPHDQHEKFVPKPESKSKRKQERDNLRAQLHQLRNKNSSADGSLNLQLSSLSSHNGSEMEVASPSFIQTAASSSPNKDNPNTETRNEKSCVFKYFKGVKSDLQYNEEVFNQWLKIQKLKYPYRLTYQRMKPEDFP